MLYTIKNVTNKMHSDYLNKVEISVNKSQANAQDVEIFGTTKQL